MGQAGPQPDEVGPEFGMTSCRGRALQALGAADSKDGVPADLQQGACIVIDRNVLRLSRRFDVVLECRIDAGDEFAQRPPR